MESPRYPDAVAESVAFEVFEERLRIGGRRAGRSCRERDEVEEHDMRAMIIGGISWCRGVL